MAPLPPSRENACGDLPRVATWSVRLLQHLAPRHWGPAVVTAEQGGLVTLHFGLWGLWGPGMQDPYGSLWFSSGLR